MTNARVVFSLLFAAILATRLCHLRIVWIEEGYPTAAAMAMQNGAWLYRDIWFDKPPLFPSLYLLWGAETGFPLRIAGAVYVALAAFTAYRFAKSEWGEREGLVAACLLSFFLTFTIPSAALVLGPDMLMIVPHMMAVHFAWRGKAIPSGIWCGAALLVNSKAIFVAAVCAFWLFRSPFSYVLALLLTQLVLLPVIRPYWQQVIAWGMVYSTNTFLIHPVLEGLKRTANWFGFHAGLLVAAIPFLRQGPGRRRWLLWFAVSLVAAWAGSRYFPRYYFHLLPVMALLASRGFRLLPTPVWRAAAAALLLIPFVRFGPRYALLASDLFAGRPHAWEDLAMEADSRAAATHLEGCKDLFVWGYRPDLYAISRCKPGTPFLDSQPLTGVFADRHLVDSSPSVTDTQEQRRLFKTFQPHYVVDGLGLYNPALALANDKDLAAWFKSYRETARTRGSIIYRFSPEAAIP